MQPRFKKVAVFVGAAALAAGVGVGVASQGDNASGAAMTQRAGGPGQGGPGGMDLSALAEELGVTEAKLQAALQAARPAPGAAAAAGHDGRGARRGARPVHRRGRGGARVADARRRSRAARRPPA